MSDINNKINELALKYFDGNNSKFAELLGTSEANIRNYRSKTEPKIDIINNIVSKLEISYEWLLGGEKGDEDKTIPAYQSIFSRGEEIPLVSIDAAAGFGTGVFAIEKQDIQALYKVPDFNGIDFMIRVKGNSMYPKYSSGDIVACRILKDSKFIEWNKPHLIATTEHGLIVKRLRKSDLVDHIQAVSDNKDYDAFDIPQDEITGLAIIVGVIRLE